MRSQFALTFASFTVGVTEFVATGLLPAVAHGLDVSIAVAGQFVAIYALAIGLGSPVLTGVSGRMDTGLRVSMFLASCAAGNLLCAVAPNGSIFMIGRVVSAMSHGAFIGVGSAVASKLAAPGQGGRAIAVMFAGLAFGNVLGVPAAVALADSYGWRSAFLATAVTNLLAGIALAAMMPSTRVSSNEDVGIGWWQDQRLRQTLIVSVLLAGGAFMVFTFVVPLLEQAAGVPAWAMRYVLLLFGCGLTAGNLLGGVFSDHRRDLFVLISLAVLTAALCLLGAVAHRPAEAILTTFVVTVAWFAAEPGLQLRAVECAPTKPELSSTLNGSAVSVGSAVGAGVGSLLLSVGEPLAFLPWAGAGIVGLGAVFAMVTFGQRSR